MMSHGIMFKIHSALALQLIALVAGTLLMAKACAADFFCKKTGKVIGGFVMIVSILSIICIGYNGIKKCCHKNKSAKSEMRWQHPMIEKKVE